MKKFETITEKKILSLAWLSLLEHREREENRNNEYKKTFGKDSAISCHHIKKLDEQIEEVYAEMLLAEEREKTA